MKEECSVDLTVYQPPVDVYLIRTPDEGFEYLAVRVPKGDGDRRVLSLESLVSPSCPWL